MEGFDLLRQIGLAVGQEVSIVEGEGGDLDASFLLLDDWGGEIIGSAVRLYGEIPEGVRSELERDFTLSVGADLEGTRTRGGVPPELISCLVGDYLMVWGKRWS